MYGELQATELKDLLQKQANSTENKKCYCEYKY